MCTTDKINVSDFLREIEAKVSFLTDVFSQDHTPTVRFSDEGSFGLYLILVDIEHNIKKANEEISI